MKLTHRSCLLLAGAWFLTGCATPRPPQTSHDTAPKSEAATPLIEATAQLAATRHSTLLPANYIWATLQDREQDAAINLAFAQALAQGCCESKLALLRALELKFIHDPKASGLDILGPELSKTFSRVQLAGRRFPRPTAGTK